MKKRLFFPLLTLALTITACNPEEKAQSLTYQGFIENIWNFESSPENYFFEGNTPAVVEFYARWCGPCRKLLPLMEQMAMEYEGRISIYTIDVDEEKRLAKFFQVEGLPVFFVFSKESFKRYTGLPTEAELRNLIEEQFVDPSKP